MLRIGFIDYFLDEWHANNYPGWIRALAEKRGWDLDVAYAYADMDKPGGLGTAAWCEKFGVERCATIEELVERSDAVVVLSPDHSQEHERLSACALKSGKPVYMDKTFSPDLASGQRMFDLAERHGTPLFSTSALRYARELEPYVSGQGLAYVATTGPGSLATYAVHQVEMIVALLGSEPKRVLFQGAGEARQLLIDFGQVKASLLQMPGLDFSVGLTQADGSAVRLTCSEFFDRLMEAMLEFFRTGGVPVPRAQTLAVMALLEAAQGAQANPGTWLEVPGGR